MRKQRPFFRAACGVATTSVDMLEWSRRDAFYQWLSTSNQDGSRVDMRLRSSRFALDEEHHAFERHTRLDFLPRSPLIASAWWSRRWTSRTPHTPAILLRRLFSIRGVFRLFAQHWNGPVRAVPPLRESQQQLYVPETWLCAQHIPVSVVNDDDFDDCFTKMQQHETDKTADVFRFERVLGTFEAARAFLRDDATFVHSLAVYQYHMPIPTRFHNRSIASLVDDKCSVAATLFWRVYHLHRLLQWAKQVDDECLAYWTQLYIDSHLPLWACMERLNRWSDAEVCDDRLQLKIAAPPAPQHPLSPENFADRARYIHGTAHHMPRRNEAVDFPKPPAPHHPQAEPHSVTLYELFYPSALNVHCWQEAPDLSHLLLIGPSVLATGPEHGESSQYYAFARVLLQKTLPERHRINNDKTSHAQLQRLYSDHPGCAHVLHECLFVAMMGNLPGSRRRYRSNFVTRLRLYSTFKYELKTDPTSLLEFMKAHRHTVAALLREYVECNTMPASRAAHHAWHFDYDKWRDLCLAGGNTWRQQVQSVTCHQRDLLSVGSRRAALLDMSTLEATMARFTQAADACCYHRSTGPASAMPFAVQFLDLATTKIYQRIRRNLKVFVAPPTTTTNNGNKKRKRAHHSDDDDDDHENPPPTAIAVAQEMVDDDDDEDVDASDVSSIQQILVRAGRRMKEVAAIADITNLLQFTMNNVPAGYNDQLLRALAWRVSRTCGPRYLPTYFLTTLFGVSDEAVHVFRHWMFFYNNYDLSIGHYETQIRELWTHDPRSFTVLWRYLFFYDMYASERRVPLTREIAEQQWMAKQRALGLQLSKTKENECEATRLVFYSCAQCRAWVHLTTPTSNLVFFRQHDRRTFDDPIDLIRDRAFSSTAWLEGREKRRVVGDVKIHSLGIYGVSPTALVANGPGRSTAVHALNTRGTGATVAGATGRAEASKPHASNTIPAYYDPIKLGFRCARPKSKNPQLLVQRTAASTQPTGAAEDDEIINEFHAQYARAVGGEKTCDESSAQRMRDLAPRVTTATHGAARARRCSAPLLKYDLCGYGRIVDNTHMYVACGACGNLTIADPRRYVPEHGYCCASHGITARGFDTLTGSLIASPDVTSMATNNTLDRIAAPGRVRLTPVLALGRLSQVQKIPLPWWATLGCVSFLDWCAQQLFAAEHARDLRERIQADLRSTPSTFSSSSSAQYVTTAHDSAGGSHIIDLVHQVPLGMPIKPHPHLRCDQCPPEVSFSHTLLLGGGRTRLCMKHAAQYMMEYCHECKTEIGPWERCKAARVSRARLYPDDMLADNPDEQVTIYLCVACYCKHKR